MMIDSSIANSNFGLHAPRDGLSELNVDGNCGEFMEKLCEDYGVMKYSQGVRLQGRELYQRSSSGEDEASESL